MESISQRRHDGHFPANVGSVIFAPPCIWKFTIRQNSKLKVKEEFSYRLYVLTMQLAILYLTIQGPSLRGRGYTWSEAQSSQVPHISGLRPAFYLLNLLTRELLSKIRKRTKCVSSALITCSRETISILIISETSVVYNA